MRKIRTFRLNRGFDVNGVSGTGIVATGIEFPDGTVVAQWLTDTPTITHYNSIADVEAIHGHDGATAVEWLAESVV